MLLKFKFDYTESGFCRTHFTTKHPDGYILYYCLMDNGSGGVEDVGLYRCSKDGEPDYKVTFKSGTVVEVVEFETPSDEYGEKLLKLFQEKVEVDG